MSEFPYEDNQGQTHWQGCWRERKHHNCAVRIAEELLAACLEAQLHDLPGHVEMLLKEAIATAMSDDA